MENYLIKWLLICFLLFGLLWASKKLLFLEKNFFLVKKPSLIQKLETVYISRNCFLHLLKLGEEKLILISESNQGISLLDELKLDELAPKDLELIFKLENKDLETKKDQKKKK